MLTCAVPKGRIFDETVELLTRGKIASLNKEHEDFSRKLIIISRDKNFRLLIVRSQDVLTYVRYGAADIGVVGLDVLDEFNCEGIYQPLDLKIGACRLSVAVANKEKYKKLIDSSQRFKVATKYPNQANAYYAKKGIQVDIIKQYGSMELAPIVGLADAIVDLVSTGQTLKVNGLFEIDLVKKISSRLIINKASFKLKNPAVTGIVRKLSEVLELKNRKSK